MTDSTPSNSRTAADDALSERECRHLLGTHTVGRVGVTSGGLPHIVPVCYLYDDGAIVFRTGPGTKLRAAASGDVLAFEVDHVDAVSGQGWSVMVLGRASILTTEHEHEGLPSFDGPRRAGERNHYVRLGCELVTGRVIDPRARV
jgi:nitroimidazol reductase NimA-like FMN-containing flavoprotein (pyridoxamine 5'-phosphate oxidase superfamily)